MYDIIVYGTTQKSHDALREALTVLQIAYPGCHCQQNQMVLWNQK